MNGRFQSATARTQQPDRDLHVSSSPVKLLTEREAADRCRYFDRGCADPVRAFQQWARRKGIPVEVAGRARLYNPRVLDAFLSRERWTVRHAPKVTVQFGSRNSNSIASNRSAR